MGKKSNAIRFGVCSLNKYSSIYRVWYEKHGDVYLGLRNIAGKTKISFHISGSWQFSLTSEQFKNNNLGKENRHFEIWKKPEGNFSGMTLGLRIAVPHSELKEKTSIIEKKIDWIHAEGDYDVTEISVWFVKPNIQIATWPLAAEYGTKLLFKFPIKNGETVYFVYRFIHFSEVDRRSLKEYKEKYKFYPRDNISGELRAAFFGDDIYGSKKIFDISLED